MSANLAAGLLAIDVGSSRVKLGWFPPVGECTSQHQASLFPIAAPQLPQPDETLAVSHANQARLESEIKVWLQSCDTSAAQLWAASVHPEALAKVQAVLPSQVRVLAGSDLPIAVEVLHPERVGIDRLLNAVAVNRLRQPGHAAIIVDIGTACTVDLVTAEGVFAGGAILPGAMLAATALHHGTAALPELSPEDFENAPAAIGKSTQQAIASGLYWGQLGAVRELIRRICAGLSESAQLFITGGGAGHLTPHLVDEFDSLRHLPNLVLAGIAVVAEECS